MTTPAIEVSHVTKEYRLGALQSFRQTAMNAGRRLLGKPVEERPLFKALDDVSFTVQPGEVVGIIGHNGAGKSTLLKMLARISTPTHGTVKVNGRVAPLIEVGAGFVPDFTGRENVYLNGAILGMSKAEIDRKFDEIVDFAEMAEFIDTPVKRYSSGMQVKLAFAVATSVEAEILIVDEVLAVGDLAFQRKCFDRMEDLIKRQGRTVLLVSHNIRQVERLCSRVMLMDHGRRIVDDIPDRACNRFYELSDRQIVSNITKSSSERRGPLQSSGEIRLLDIGLFDPTGERINEVQYRRPVEIRIRVRVNAALTGVTVGLGAHTPDLLYIASDDSVLTQREPWNWVPGEIEVCYRIPSVELYPGTYALRLGIALADNDRVLLYDENLSHFQIVTAGQFRSRVVGQGFFAFGGYWRSDQMPFDDDSNAIEENLRVAKPPQTTNLELNR